MEFYDCPETVGNFMIPTDEHIFFRGAGIPPTGYYIICVLLYQRIEIDLKARSFSLDWVDLSEENRGTSYDNYVSWLKNIVDHWIE